MITLEQARLLLDTQLEGGLINEDLDEFSEYINDEMGKPMFGQPKTIENMHLLLDMWENK